MRGHHGPDTTRTANKQDSRRVPSIGGRDHGYLWRTEAEQELSDWTVQTPAVMQASALLTINSDSFEKGSVLFELHF